MIKSLISMASPENGIITNISYRVLSDLLTVTPTQGRKDCGTPKKETIRSYLRTIEKQCGEHFKVTTVGQSLRIEFPTLPAIYARHFENTEVYTDENMDEYTLETEAGIDDGVLFDDVKRKEESTQVYTASSVNSPVKKNNIKNKTNKHTNEIQNSFSSCRKPISRDFYPSEELIELALEKGLMKVTSDVEIKRFINYNLGQATLWANYDFVFLNWLERDHNPHIEHTTNHIKKINNQPSPRKHYERSSHTIDSIQSSVAKSIAKNQRIIDEAFGQQTCGSIEGTCIETMDCFNRAV
jgi:hypothetical protein